MAPEEPLKRAEAEGETLLNEGVAHLLDRSVAIRAECRQNRIPVGLNAMGLAVAAQGLRPCVTLLTFTRPPRLTLAALTGDDTDGVMNMATMPIDKPLHRVTEIAEQMPPICDLDGLWRSVPGPVGMGSSPVANDDFDTGVLLEPGSDGVGIPLRQKLENAPSFEIQYDRAIAMTTPKGPVVDTNAAR